MTRLASVLCVLAGNAAGSIVLDAQAAPPALQVQVGDSTHVITTARLRAMTPDTIRASAHGGPQQVFVGPSLAAVLRTAGVRLDSLRGPALRQYVLVEASDGYRVVFAIAELSAGLTGRRVILAHTVDGAPLPADEGPWRIVAEGDLRPTRWVRQVTALRLRVGS
jgi:hypothetical protein